MKYVINYLSHLSSQYGIKDILLFSADDKAKVKIGIPAVSKFVKFQKFLKLEKAKKPRIMTFQLEKDCLKFLLEILFFIFS